MKTLALWLGAVALGLQASAPSGQEVARRFVPGEAVRYVVRVELERGEAVSAVESRVLETVEKVDDGRVTVRTKYLSVKVGSAASGSRPDDRTVYGSDGSVLAVEGGDADALRLARALAVSGVPASGGTWTFEQKPVSQPAAPLARTVCTLDGTEEVGGVPSARVRFEFREVPTSGEPLGAKGVYWLAVGDGRLVKLEAELTGIPGLPDKDAKARVTVELDKER